MEIDGHDEVQYLHSMRIAMAYNEMPKGNALEIIHSEEGSKYYFLTA